MRRDDSLTAAHGSWVVGGAGPGFIDRRPTKDIRTKGKVCKKLYKKDIS